MTATGSEPTNHLVRKRTLNHLATINHLKAMDQCS